jgi:PTS system N-acetylgalactosamine-specific IIA component
MIGIILCGNGTWASGTAEAITLLAGRPECFEWVDFRQEDSTDDLAEHLRQKVEILKPKCRDGIVIFTDLEMASPYKEAVEMRGDYIMETEIEVIAGTNAGMVLQMNMARSYIHDMNMFLETAMSEGKKQISYFEENDHQEEE